MASGHANSEWINVFASNAPSGSHKATEGGQAPSIAWMRAASSLIRKGFASVWTFP